MNILAVLKENWNTTFWKEYNLLDSENIYSYAKIIKVKMT